MRAELSQIVQTVTLAPVKNTQLLKMYKNDIINWSFCAARRFLRARRAAFFRPRKFHRGFSQFFF